MPSKFSRRRCLTAFSPLLTRCHLLAESEKRRYKIRDIQCMVLNGARTYTLVKVTADDGTYGIAEACGSPTVWHQSGDPRNEGAAGGQGSSRNRCAPKDVVEQMRRVVEQLDRPGSVAALGQNIEMTLTLLRCSPTASATAAALPADIEQVAQQLRTATPCKNAEIWDALPIRLQEGKTSSSELQLPGPALVPGKHVELHVRMNPESVYRKNQSRYVRFSLVSLNFGKMRREDYEPKGLRWAVDYDCRRPRLIQIHKSSDVSLEGLTVRRFGLWTVHICYWQRVSTAISNATISNATTMPSV